MKMCRKLIISVQHLLYRVQLDPGAAVPDTDEVIQSRADDTGGCAHQGGDITAVTVHVADAAPCQDIPQADGAVLTTACQNHRLRGATEFIAESYFCNMRCYNKYVEILLTWSM